MRNEDLRQLHVVPQRHTAEKLVSKASSIVHPIDYSIKDAKRNSYPMSIVPTIWGNMCNQQQRNVYGMILLTQYVPDQNCQTHAYNSHIRTVDCMDQFRQAYATP